MKTCDVCRGARVIRLPFYRSVVAFEVTAPKLEESHREYACPECSGIAKEDRIAVLDTHSEVSTHIDDPGFQEHARRQAAHMLVEHLLKGGFIDFTQGRSDPQKMTRSLVATLGVVAKGPVASIEQRATERGMALANAVADEAINQIDNWGSYYGRPVIGKSEATDFIREAMKRVSISWNKAA